MSFVKLSRLRHSERVRELVSQTQLSAKDLVMPYFVIEGKNRAEPVDSMPGISRLSIDNLIRDIEIARGQGIRAVILFGLSTRKDNSATEAYRSNGLIPRAIKAIKTNTRETVVITDVCLCGYTTHGHCGIIKDKAIDSDLTLRVLAKIALSHAEAGADFVAPSAMMDGQVRKIREVLDKKGLKHAGILAYSAKYASGFYGPFREALNSHPQFGDRKAYQLDYRNSDEAMREIGQDIDEGADIVMVKPALAYLDIIARAKQDFYTPIAAYNVSGEYSLVKAGSRQGFFRERDIIMEILTCIKRAGADLIISYHAREVVRWLRH